MPKGNILSDSFEQLVELGQSTVKQGGKQIGQTFSPLKLLETISPQSSQSSQSLQKEKAKSKDNKSTPLDLDKLHQKYQDQEKIKVENLRHRLFQIVKQEEEKSLQRKKTEEYQKKQKEEAEKEQKKHHQQQQQKAQQAEEEPRGKIRRSIFSPKKIAKRQQAEVNPATGKQ